MTLAETDDMEDVDLGQDREIVDEFLSVLSFMFLSSPRNLQCL
jgi:hypothetical protein